MGKLGGFRFQSAQRRTEQVGRGADRAYSALAVVRPGDDLSATTADTLDHLDPEMLADTGWALAHYLMVLSPVMDWRFRLVC